MYVLCLPDAPLLHELLHACDDASVQCVVAISPRPEGSPEVAPMHAVKPFSHDSVSVPPASVENITPIALDGVVASGLHG